MSVIRRLEEAVVNRIAAGEVIQRPSSALKELLENSLDAGSTQINVLVKEGGNKLLQVQDNGHGIRFADLPILCHRHTTSKLKEFEDLETINTLGFRGEALCSISFVSHLTITTMTAEEAHGWRAKYKDSEMEPPGPKPQACVKGTTVAAEDIFYNVPTRKRALKGAAEEYNLILDITSRYAIFKAGVAFSCKRQGESRTDITTLAAASRLDNIRAIYGPVVAKELMEVELANGEEPGPHLGPEDGVAFRLKGYVSGLNYNSKKTVLILFINGRMVECVQLRRTLETLYTSIMPGSCKSTGGAGARPWLFFDLILPPRQVEVNMHPTKREVGFLHQDEIIEAIRAGVENHLSASNNARTFTQMQLPYSSVVPESLQVRSTKVSQTAASTSYRPEKMVRTDPTLQTMDTFLSTSLKSAAVAGSVSRRKGGSDLDLDLNRSTMVQLGLQDEINLLDMTDAVQNPLLSTLRHVEDAQQPGVPEAAGEAGLQPRCTVPQRYSADPAVTCSDLGSIQELLAEVEADAHAGLVEILRGHTFVGMADATLGLLQHQTKLYLVDVHRLSQEFFYQQVLRRFQGLRSMALSPPAPVRELILLALDVEEAWGRWQPAPEEGGSREEVASLVEELLREQGPMLSEYLALEVRSCPETGACVICSLPVLLEDYQPDPNRLPTFILALARDVEWGEEKACFKNIAQALAKLYALQHPLLEAATRVSEMDKVHEMDRTANQMDSQVNASDKVHEMDRTANQEQQGWLQTLEIYCKKPEAGDIGADHSEVQLKDEIVVNTCSTATAKAGHVVNAGLRDTERATTSTEDLNPMEAAIIEGGQVQRKRAREGSNVHMDTESGLLGEEKRNVTGGVSCSWLNSSAREWAVKHVLFPAMRTHLRLPKSFGSNGACVQVAALERLYRIFERC